MDLTSTAFASGQPIPMKFSGDGQDISPPLAWSEPPAGTVELALICDDPDAPTPQPWVHWVISRIPATTRSLPESLSGPKGLRKGQPMVEGRNSWNKAAWGGPAPPPGHGTHRYHFRIYALDHELPAEARRDKDSLLRAMAGHVLAQGELVGTYRR